jgi:hypothetical protein
MINEWKTDDKERNRTLDPSKDKEKFKEQITDIVYEQLLNVKREDVKKAVDEKYEELLNGATVMRHIPTITEGAVKSKFRGKRKR